MEDNGVGLEWLLTQRPEQADEPIIFPEGDPQAPAGRIMDFLSGLAGNPRRRSGPAITGAMAGMFLPGKLLQGLKGAETGLLTRTIAPKRAAQELTDLLLGRSKRVPTPNVYKPLSEADASLEAMLMSRTNSIPPAPTKLRLQSVPGVAQQKRTLSRQPGISEDFKTRQTSIGGNPSKQTDVFVGAGTNPSRQTSLTKDRWTAAANAQASKDLHKVKPITQEAGSLHAAGLNPLTKKEIHALIEGPINAFKKGGLTKDQLNTILATNRAKIQSHNQAFTEKDFELYRQGIERAIASKQKL